MILSLGSLLLFLILPLVRVAVLFTVEVYCVLLIMPFPTTASCRFGGCTNFQMENNSANPARRQRRIPGGFDDSDSDGDGDEHNPGAYSTSSFLFHGPGITISRTSGNPITTITSTMHPDGTEVEEAGQPGGISGPNMVEMLQTIFASIMGDQGMERARQQAQGEPGDGAGEDAPGAAGGDHTPQDPRTRGNAPPMPPGLAGLFGSGPPPPGSRFVYEQHTSPPRGTLPVDDLPSCVPLFLLKI